MIGAYLLELGKSIALVVLVIFFAFGGFSGIASLVTWRWKTKFEADMKADFDRKLEAFKAEQSEKVQRVIETHKAELQKEADELSQTLSEKITRRSKAFDFRISKQYEFYERYGTIVKSIVEQSYLVVTQINSVANIDKDDEVTVNDKNEYKDNIKKVLIPECRKLLELVNNFEVVVISYSFYLDNDTSIVCRECYLKYREFTKNINQCIMLIEKMQKLSGIVDDINRCYMESSESITKVGKVVKHRIDEDSRQ